MFNRKKKAAAIALSTLEAEATALSDHLALSQTQIEVMADALNIKDAETFALIENLHHTMGGERPKGEEDTMIRLREMRAHADMFIRIKDVLAGRFDADKALLRQLACALGTSTFTREAVVERAGQLSGLANQGRGHLRSIRELEDQVKNLKRLLAISEE